MCAASIPYCRRCSGDSGSVADARRLRRLQQHWPDKSRDRGGDSNGSVRGDFALDNGDSDGAVGRQETTMIESFFWASFILGQGLYWSVFRDQTKLHLEECWKACLPSF